MFIEKGTKVISKYTNEVGVIKDVVGKIKKNKCYAVFFIEFPECKNAVCGFEDFDIVQ